MLKELQNNYFDVNTTWFYQNFVNRDYYCEDDNSPEWANKIFKLVLVIETKVGVLQQSRLEMKTTLSRN